jgi:6-phosphofructokinase 1
MKTLGILVGGGPSPGINAVIAAATIEARNRGLAVVGFQDGFRWLMRGDRTRVESLDIAALSRIHFDGGSILRTSRANPAQSPESLRQVTEALRALDLTYLLTIGGDDTAFGASQVARALEGRLGVVHVPKTIDNDLPLPPEIPTFGFTTAVDLGKDLVRNLMKDAATAEKWFFVMVMGRHAGHLALGIGGGAGATLTVIGEEFPGSRIGIEAVGDVLEGAIIKRRMLGRDHGVALLAEGLIEKLDYDRLGPVTRDAYGNVRLADLGLARVLKEHVAASLGARGIEVGIVVKDLGYELRCAPPGAFDIQYCRALGYWATRFLLDGGSQAMATIQGGRLVPVPFEDIIDPSSGRIRVRYVDIRSEAYETLYAYMIRIKPEDLDRPETRRALAAAGNLDEAELVRRFGTLRPPFAAGTGADAGGAVA